MLFLKNLLLRNFQGCCLLFNYQGSLLFLFSRSNSDILSCCFLFVKNFFVLFFCDSFQAFACFESALIYYHVYLRLSTTFLNLFFTVFHSSFIWKKERRKRDLNPRAGFPTYTLSRGASSASWVFLLAWISVISYSIYSVVHQQCICDYTRLLSQCQCLNSNFFIFLWFVVMSALSVPFSCAIVVLIQKESQLRHRFFRYIL